MKPLGTGDTERAHKRLEALLYEPRHVFTGGKEGREGGQEGKREREGGKKAWRKKGREGKRERGQGRKEM